jgi:4-aminobutyrate aminotransferase/(S)-3-amino-2-methylpropionate transaminase
LTRSEDVFRKYREYLITSFVKRVEPVAVAEGKGALVKDLDGREYLDCFSGISVANTGHCHDKVVKAIKDQADKLLHCCTYMYHVAPAAELAERLAKIAPGGLRKTFFCNSGAEAIECAMKMGRKFTKKHEIIALMCSFHGRTLGALSVTGQWGRRRFDMGPYLGGVSFAPAPYCYRCSLGHTYPGCGIQCAEMIEDIIEYSSSNNVAEFIAEPLLGEGGLIVPPPEYFKTVKKVLDRHGILFIVDEVQTGFARTGKMFGIEHYGVNPDIMCLAKGIASGMPLGACIAKAEIADSYEPGDHLSTFGGNPVSCAAGIASLEVMSELDLPKQAKVKGEYLLNRLRELQETESLIGEIRGKGLMVGVELVEEHKHKTPAQEKAAKIRELLRMRGILIGVGGVKGNVLRIQPPLVIAEEQLDTLMDHLTESMKEVHQ